MRNHLIAAAVFATFGAGTVQARAMRRGGLQRRRPRVLVPLDAFGRNRKGLMLDVSKDEFDKMVAKANAAAHQAARSSST